MVEQRVTPHEASRETPATIPEMMALRKLAYKQVEAHGKTSGIIHKGKQVQTRTEALFVGNDGRHYSIVYFDVKPYGHGKQRHLNRVTTPDTQYEDTMVIMEFGIDGQIAHSWDIKYHPLNPHGEPRTVIEEDLRVVRSGFTVPITRTEVQGLMSGLQGAQPKGILRWHWDLRGQQRAAQKSTPSVALPNTTTR